MYFYLKNNYFIGTWYAKYPSVSHSLDLNNLFYKSFILFYFLVHVVDPDFYVEYLLPARALPASASFTGSHNNQ